MLGFHLTTIGRKVKQFDSGGIDPGKETPGPRVRRRFAGGRPSRGSKPVCVTASAWYKNRYAIRRVRADIDLPDPRLLVAG